MIISSTYISNIVIPQDAVQVKRPIINMVQNSGHIIGHIGQGHHYFENSGA